MDVQLPNGRILRGVPEGTTKEQIAAKLGMSVEELSAKPKAEALPMPVQSPPEQKSFIGDVTKAAVKAGNEIMKADTRSAPRFGLRVAGSGTRFLGDVTAAGLSALTPDFIGEPLQQAASAGLNAIGQLPTFGGGTLANDLGKEWGSFQQANPEMAQDVKDIATVGVAILPLPKMGGQVVQGAKTVKQTGKNLVNVAKLSADDLAKQAGVAYKRARQVGGTIKPNVVDDFIDNARKSVTPQTAAGKIVAGSDDAVTKIMDRLEGLRGKPIDLDEFQEVDELLGDYIDSYVKPTGGVDKTGRKILLIQDELRAKIENATPNDIIGSKEGFDALKEGRALWSRQAKLRDIEKIILRAESMDNPSTGIRTGFRTLISNPKRMRGYSTAEKEAIKAAAKSGKVEVLKDLLRPVTSRLAPIVGLGTGNVGAAAALNLTGMAAREGVDALKMMEAERIAQLVARGGKAVKPSLVTQAANIGLGSLANTAGLAGRGIQGLEAIRAPQAGLVNLLDQEEKPKSVVFR